MYRFILKYRKVIINAAICTFLVLASIDIYRDFFLGAALGAELLVLGESVGDLKRKEKDNQVKEEEVSMVI
jgi:hypothetical protein